MICFFFFSSCAGPSRRLRREGAACAGAVWAALRGVDAGTARARPMVSGGCSLWNRMTTYDLRKPFASPSYGSGRCRVKPRRSLIADARHRATEPPGSASGSVWPGRLAGPAARFAHDQARRDRAHAVSGLAGDGGQQQAGGDPPDLLQAHVDAGERRLRAERHRLPVVEADQGDIVRYPAAARAQRVGDAAGDLVAAAEDGVRVRLVGEQLPGRVAAPALAPLTEPRAAVRPRARRRQRAGESGRPLARGEEALR